MPSKNAAAEVIEQAVQLACRAPSHHNSQPWRWVLTGEHLQLHLDRNHCVATDMSGREALIGCGAALDHVQVAMAAAGWHSHVDRFPSPNNRTYLAAITFTSLMTVTSVHRRRADAILARRSDRLPFLAPDDWPSFTDALAARLDDTDAFVDTVDEGDRERLAQASKLTDLLHLYDRAYHAELHWWTTSFTPDDGIPTSALVSVTENARVDIARSFPVTSHQNRRPQITHDQAAILVISARDRTPADILRSGETLSKVLLEATMVGLSTCTLTHLTEQKATKDIVSAVTDCQIPTALIRLGITPALEALPPPTPRRPLSDVYTVLN